jgi:hypothetical protein
MLHDGITQFLARDTRGGRCNTPVRVDGQLFPLAHIQKKRVRVKTPNRHRVTARANGNLTLLLVRQTHCFNNIIRASHLDHGYWPMGRTAEIEYSTQTCHLVLCGVF